MIKPDLRNFLAEYIDSAELLDVLMLFLRGGEETWTSESVANRVFSVPQAAEKRLQELVSRGLIAPRTDRPGAFQLQVRDPALNDTLDELKRAYQANRAEVLGLVFKLKANPLQNFADAFKLRGDK